MTFTRRRDDADALAARDRSADADGNVSNDADARRDDLVLHLHRLDDAEQLTGLHGVAVGDGDLEHRALHRADDRTVPCHGAARRRSFETTPREVGPRRLADVESNVVGAPVHLDSDETRNRRPGTVRSCCDTCCLMRERLLELLRSLRELLRFDHACARLAADEARVLQQRAVESEQRRGPFDAELGKRAKHPRDRALAVDVVNDQLGDHRVVEVADLVTRLDAGVDPNPRAGRLAIRGDPSWCRKEPTRDVLRIDPALDGVPSEGDVGLRDRERLTGRDENLLSDQVEPGDELGDGVLDLDPGVHLHEEVLAVAGEQALDRPGRAIPRRPRGLDRDRADPLSQRRVHRGRGRLLDELLVSALDRAVALAEVDHVAVTVGQHLNLDVARILDETLDVDPRVGEVLLALPRRSLERALGVAGRPDDLHPLAPAPRCGLDDQRIADLVAECDDLGSARDGIDRARNNRHARGAHRRARSRLRAHQLDRLGRGPDPGQARVADEPCERGVLGEESIPGVNRLCSRPQRGLDQHLAAQVALRRRPGADAIRLVGGPHVRAPPVRIRVHRDAPDSQLTQGAEHPNRDLTPVRDQHLRERRHSTRILPEP